MLAVTACLQVREDCLWIVKVDGDVKHGEGAGGGELGEHAGVELDGVLARGQEAVGVRAAAAAAELQDVEHGVAVVVRKAARAGGTEAVGAEVAGEVGRACDGAEEEWRGGRCVRNDEGAVDDPDGFAVQGGAGGEEAADDLLLRGADDEDRGATQGLERFAEVAGREERVAHVFRGEKGDVGGAGEGVVGKAVVEQVDVRRG